MTTQNQCKYGEAWGFDLIQSVCYPADLSTVDESCDPTPDPELDALILAARKAKEKAGYSVVDL